ncbi:MAG: tetratricopeptide repeat protein [Candidatus Kapabacteria bacterium]|nr:tetratricopeptide repeat protein [Candidatus Kapabacteria bacterium]
MVDSKKLEVFISYCWANAAIVDEIDLIFKNFGLILKRDIRDSEYKTSLSDFMKQIKNSDYALMIISQEFLRSENCMYEAMELFSDIDFDKKFLPIYLEKCDMYNTNGKLNQYQYWEDKYNEIKMRIKSLDDFLNVGEYLKINISIIKNIKDNILLFLNKIAELNAKDLKYHKENGFKDIFNIIGFKDTKMMNELLEIYQIEDINIQFQKIESFLINYPNHQEALYFKAFIKSLNKEYEIANNYWDNYLALFKDDYVALNNKGLTLFYLGKYNEALEYVDKSLFIKNDFVESISNKGMILSKLSREEEAIQFFKKAIEIDSNYIHAFNGIGVILLNQGKYRESLIYLKRAYLLDPTQIDVLSNIGLSFEYLNQLPQALDFYLECLKINNEDPYILKSLGQTYLQLGIIDKALEYYRLSIDNKLDFVEVLYNIGAIYSHQNRHDLAIEYFNKCLKYNKDDTGALNNKGAIFLRMKQYDKAFECFEKIIAINPKHYGAIYNMACIYAINDDNKKMYESLQKLKENDNNLFERIPFDTHFEKYRKDPEFINLFKKNL